MGQTSRCAGVAKQPVGLSEFESAEALDDDAVLSEMLDWMKNRLPCVAGRREFNRGRYMVRLVTADTVPAVFAEFREKLAAGKATACLYVFNAPELYSDRGTVLQGFEFLAKQMAQLGDKRPSDLMNGEALTLSIPLKCPVTNQDTVFDDFECIAFCPQSANRDDPLYDPLMAAPHVCVNMSSDVYAFSRFVSDSILQAAGKHPWEIRYPGQLEALMRSCVGRWQRVATVTIANYEAITDTSLCPVHVTSAGTHWVAAHKDPAFAETVKEPHSHELPVLYGHRAVDRWLEWFRAGGTYDAGGMARDGKPCQGG